MKKKKQPDRTQQSFDMAAQDRTAQQAQIARANQQSDEAARIGDETAASLQPALSRYTTPDAGGMTPVRRALTRNLVQQNSNAFDNQRVNTRNRALMAGFGYAQPSTYGAETGVENERAKAIGNIPAQVELAATDPEMQAMQMQQNLGFGRAQLRQGIAGTALQGGGLYDPMGYFQTGTGLEEAARKRKTGLLAGLAKVGLNLAAPGLGSLFGGGSGPTPSQDGGWG